MMTFAEFPVMISYSQLSVFDRALDRPFNDWTNRHVAQGFSWRPGSVAFGTIEEGGRHLVTVSVGSEIDEPAVGAIRVIEVPFEVPKTGAIEIASISSGVPLELPTGIYQLRFECFDQANSPNPRIRLSFRRDDKPQFKLVRADPELSPDGELLLTALPA